MYLLTILHFMEKCPGTLMLLYNSHFVFRFYSKDKLVVVVIGRVEVTGFTLSTTFLLALVPGDLSNHLLGGSLNFVAERRLIAPGVVSVVVTRGSVAGTWDASQ